MKCKYCGGNILTEEVKCPFCGMENPLGVDELKKLNKEKKINTILDKDVKKKNVWKVVFTIWTYVNIGLLIIAVISSIIAGTQIYKAEKRQYRGDRLRERAETYYKYSDMRNLYILLSDNDGFTDDKVPVNYRHVALVYSNYEKMRCAFAAVTEEYEKSGVSNQYEVEDCIQKALVVYNANLSYIYMRKNLTNEDLQKIERYRNEAKSIITETFNVPIETLRETEDSEEYYYSDDNPVIEYAVKEWPCE